MKKMIGLLVASWLALPIAILLQSVIFILYLLPIALVFGFGYWLAGVMF